MKKITLMLSLLLILGKLTEPISAQCTLDETVSFTGTYQIEQLVPSIFGYDTFTDGTGEPFTLFSEETDVSQQEPNKNLINNQRSFDAQYLAVLGFNNTLTYIIEFDDCGVTFSDVETTGVQCSAGISLAPSSGGNFNSDDDTEFILIFEDDSTQDCVESSPLVELRFFKGATLMCPGTIEVATNADGCNAIVNFDPPTATDIDGSSLTPIQTEGLASGSFFPLGASTVEFTVTSAVNGQVTKCSFDIVVNDLTNPIITDCIGDTIVGEELPDFTVDALAGDNCDDDVTITQDPVAGTILVNMETIEVTLTATDNFGNETSCTFNVTSEVLGVQNNTLNEVLNIYPNPTQGVFTLGNATLQPLENITITDMQGRVVKNIRLTSTESYIELSLNDFPSGIYFLRVRSTKGSIVKRIVKL